MKKEYLIAKNVSVYYGDFLALDNVNLKCKEGEFVAIVGKSGSGKSSFLNALAGFIPYEGEIKRPESIGYVFQSYALYPWMTVQKNIEFGLGNLSREERRKLVNEMLKQIDMKEYAKRYPLQLSGGQIQRVALARAMAPNPDVLLMDEPYGALDHHTRDKMQDWLLTIWNKTKKTVLFVTHYIEEAIFLADRVVVQRDKKFVTDLVVPFSRPRCDSIRFTEQFLDMKHLILDYMEIRNNV
jgi:NitT/TauT family transport system ATP-binding protein